MVWFSAYIILRILADKLGCPYRREASIKQEGIVGSEEEEKIPLEHYAMLEDAFRMHDTKGNGFLTKEDLRR